MAQNLNYIFYYFRGIVGVVAGNWVRYMFWKCERLPSLRFLEPGLDLLNFPKNFFKPDFPDFGDAGNLFMFSVGICSKSSFESIILKIGFTKKISEKKYSYIWFSTAYGVLLFWHVLKWHFSWPIVVTVTFGKRKCASQFVAAGEWRRDWSWSFILPLGS